MQVEKATSEDFASKTLEEGDFSPARGIDSLWFVGLMQKILILDSEAFILIFDVRNCLDFETAPQIERLLCGNSASRWGCRQDPNQALATPKIIQLAQDTHE